MEEELKLAAAAMEAGDRKRAQRLLALFLKREPENVHGWLALSQTVDDEKKKRAFLSKVLSIDPLNETARARLAALDEADAVPEPEPVDEVVEDAPAEPQPEPEPEPVPPPVTDLPSDSAPEEEEPPWEVEPAGIAADAALATTDESEETDEAPLPAEPEPEEPEAPVPNEEAKTQLFVQSKSSTIIEPKPAYPPAAAEEPQLEASRPDWLLLLLTALAIIVGMYLLYLLWQLV